MNLLYLTFFTMMSISIISLHFKTVKMQANFWCSEYKDENWFLTKKFELSYIRKKTEVLKKCRIYDKKM